MDGKPGFSRQALAYLKDCREGDKGWAYKKCVLLLDGMKIRELLEYDRANSKYCGFVDLGQDFSSDNDIMASEALVFMAASLKGSWKQPFAYFLIKGISAKVQTELVLHAINLLNEHSISVQSLTLDGHPSNISMLTKLGCSIRPDNLKSSFETSSGSKIFCFIDACHCLKLVRNSFAKLARVIIPEIGTARWSHLMLLNETQKKEGLHAATKLSDRHIFFEQQKMKVSKPD